MSSLAINSGRRSLASPFSFAVRTLALLRCLPSCTHALCRRTPVPAPARPSPRRLRSARRVLRQVQRPLQPSAPSARARHWHRRSSFAQRVLRPPLPPARQCVRARRSHRRSSPARRARLPSRRPPRLGPCARARHSHHHSCSAQRALPLPQPSALYAPAPPSRRPSLFAPRNRPP
jgi:hypothetical protein